MQKSPLNLIEKEGEKNAFFATSLTLVNFFKTFLSLSLSLSALSLFPIGSQTARACDNSKLAFVPSVSIRVKCKISDSVAPRVLGRTAKSSWRIFFLSRDNGKTTVGVVNETRDALFSGKFDFPNALVKEFE